MKRYATTALSVLAIGLSSPVMAAFDGTEPLICATLEVHACEVDGPCWEENVEGVDAPQFLRVSVQDKKVTGIRPSGAKVDANIDLINHASKLMFLQGVAGDRSWSVVIDETSGRMSGTVSDHQDAYIIFGACTPR
jgi:hypothetical protein